MSDNALPPAAPPDVSARPRRGRLALLAGIGLALLGIAVYAVQLALGRLTIPWYMPALGTLGLALAASSLWQARSAGRVLAAILVLLLASAEWAFVLAPRLPPYTSPVNAGKPMPEFATSRADGTRFTQDDLAGDQNNVLVFIRGYW